MWQQRSSYEQANVLDVTIQCQLNVASKNIAEFSTIYSSPHVYPTSNFQTSDPTMTSPCMQRTQDYNGTYGYHDMQQQKERYVSDYGDIPASCYATYPNSGYGYNSAFECVNTNKSTSSVSSDATHVNDSSSHHVVRSGSGYSHMCMDDSGYASPVTSVKQHRNQSAFSPPTDVNKQHADGVSNTPQRPASFSYQDALTSPMDEPCEEMKIAMRERDVTQRLFSLRSQNNDVANEIEHYYQSQTALIDIERHNIICQMAYDKKSSDSINKYYNRKLVTVLESVEQKLSLIESSGKCRKSAVRTQQTNSKKSRLLPKHAVKILESWYQENLENPYPSREVTLSMASDGGITVEQIRKWFANKRNRSRNNKLKACLIEPEDVVRS